VSSGVSTTGRNAAASLTGNVDLTWHIRDSLLNGIPAQLTLQWNLADEQPGFNRGASYISHFQVCPPPTPPNCDAGFYENAARSPASGAGPFTQSRSNVTSFNSPSFVVSSEDIVYRFINMNETGPGDGNWSNPQNWTNYVVPSTTILDGMEVVIDPMSGNECIITGPVSVMPGGKLKVMDGKKLTIKPN
jgi:hypothetical protein